MFFLKKIFQKNLNIDEIEDLLFDNGVEPKFADLIISKIKENKSQEEDIKNNRNHLNSMKGKNSSEWREYATKCMIEIMDNKTKID